MTSLSSPQPSPWIYETRWSLEPHETIEHLPSTQAMSSGLPQERFKAYSFAERNWEACGRRKQDKNHVGDMSNLQDLRTADTPIPSDLINTENISFLQANKTYKNFLEIDNSSTINHSRRQAEQAQTMSNPNPKSGTRDRYITPVGIIPPRSSSSPAILNTRRQYEPQFVSFAPSSTSNEYSSPTSMAPNCQFRLKPTIPRPNLQTQLHETQNWLNFLDHEPATPTLTSDTRWSYIQNRRNGILGLRSEIRQMRKSLREQQTAKAVAEDQFFQRLLKKEIQEKLFVTETETVPIVELMLRYQQQRDDYGPLEDDCNRLEDRLYEEEFSLYQLETDFLKDWATLSRSDSFPRPPASVMSSHGAETIARGSTKSFYHPRVEKYLSKQGDLDLLLERLNDILDERENLEEQRQTRDALGLSLASEEQAWLDSSRYLLDEVEGQIELMEVDVSELKQECLAQNLIDEDGEPIDMRERDLIAFKDERALETGSEISEYSRYPTLLPQPLVREDEGSQYLQNLGETEYSLGARINKWLLDRLRDSALEFNLLARTYDQAAKGKGSSDIWQISVLSLWYKDETIGFEIHTSTVKSEDSGDSQKPMHQSEKFAKTLRTAQVQIRVHSSLPTYGKSAKGDASEDRNAFDQYEKGRRISSSRSQ